MLTSVFPCCKFPSPPSFVWPRRAAGSAITQRRAPSPSFHCKSHRKRWDLDPGLDLWTRKVRLDRILLSWIQQIKVEPSDFWTEWMTESWIFQEQRAPLSRTNTSYIYNRWCRNVCFKDYILDFRLFVGHEWFHGRSRFLERLDLKHDALFMLFIILISVKIVSLYSSLVGGFIFPFHW